MDKRIRIKFITPMGTFYTKSEVIKSYKMDDFFNLNVKPVITSKTSFSFTNNEDNMVIIMDETLKNSVIVMEAVDV